MNNTPDERINLQRNWVRRYNDSSNDRIFTRSLGDAGGRSPLSPETRIGPLRFQLTISHLIDHQELDEDDDEKPSFTPCSA